MQSGSTMLRILTIIFICVVGSSTGNRYGTNFGDCPAGHTQTMMNCIEPIQRLQSHPSQNLRQMCSTMNTGLDCLGDIMEKCADQPDVADMASMMNIDQMRSLMSSQCSGGPAPTYQPGSNSNCPSGYSQRIMECVGPMQNIGPLTDQNIGRACGVVISGLGCLDNILENCAGEPEVQAMSSMLNMNTMRDMVQTQLLDSADHRCVFYRRNTQSFQLWKGSSIGIGPAQPPTVSVPVPNRVSTCTRKDKRKMQKCTRRMQMYATQTLVRCRKVRSTLDCMTIMMEKCSSIIGVPLKSRLNTLREFLTENCVETNYIVDETDEVDDLEELQNDNEIPEEYSCPYDYVTRLQRCVGGLNQKMGYLMGNGDVSSAQCKEIYAKFDCTNSIFSACSNMPEVIAVSSSGFDEDQIRDYIAGFCPAGGSETNTETEGEGPSDATYNKTEPEVEVDVGDAGCPARHTQKLQECMLPMQRVGHGPLQNIDEMCRIMNTSFNCVQDIVDKCPSQQDVETVTSRMNLDQMKAMVQSQCSGGPISTPRPGGKPNSNCPSDYAQILTECVGPVQGLDRASVQNRAKACQVAKKGFNCLSKIITECSGEPEIQAMATMLDEMRTTVHTHCSSVAPNGCSFSNPADELQRCNGYLTSFQRDSDSMQEECRVLFEGFDCFRNLIRSCPNDPAVIGFTSMVDIETALKSMRAYCPGLK